MAAQQMERLEAETTIPSLRGSALFGNFLGYRRDPIAFYMGLGWSGDISSYRMLTAPVVFINEPRLIQSLLVERATDYDKGKLQRYLFRPLAGNGLVNSEGAFHQSQRKLLAPAFQPRHLSAYADTMVAYADRWQARWADGAAFDIHAEMMRLTMDVVSKVLLGADVSRDADTLSAAINTAVHWFQYATTSLIPTPLWAPTPTNLRTKRAIALIKRKVQGIISAHQENRRSGADVEGRGDLLTMLLGARDDDGTAMDDGQILDEVLTFFVAGHETTALALSWSFYLLTQHPDAAARLYAEVDAVLGDRAPTYADLPRLPYALRVLKEALRLYPPSSAILRVALRDTVLEDGRGRRYPIRKGAAVVFSQYVLHRRPDYFPDPERFDPERFRPDAERALPRYAYLPFGAGHRVCIGSHFATMEGHLLLATIARTLRFTLAESATPVAPELVLTLRPSRPIMVTAMRR